MKKKLKSYLPFITDESLRNAVEQALDHLPEYFWEIPASSTGKYHPRFTTEEGGLVKHTTFAVDMARQLFIIEDFSPLEMDIVISALLLHDGLKNGVVKSKFTNKDHPKIMADWLYEIWGGPSESDVAKAQVINCVETHMGQWSIGRKPETQVEKFVHLCDYIASRRVIDDYYLVNICRCEEEDKQ